MVRDLEMLEGLQNYDGGFPYWRRGQDSIPFNTIHAAHAMQQAREMDYRVPEEMWFSVLAYLQDIESHYPSYYSRPDGMRVVGGAEHPATALAECACR